MRQFDEYYRTTWNADFLEEFQDHVVLMYETYVMDKCCKDGESKAERDKKLEIIREFVSYCVKESKDALVVPRGRDGTSFLERREASYKQHELATITTTESLK